MIFTGSFRMKSFIIFYVIFFTLRVNMKNLQFVQFIFNLRCLMNFQTYEYCQIK